MDEEEKGAIISKLVDDALDKEFNKINYHKIRRSVFVFMTCLFVVGAVVLYFLSFYTAALFMQLCIGAATGSFVVAMQETVLDQQYEIEKKGKKELKDKIVKQVNELLDKGKDED